MSVPNYHHGITVLWDILVTLSLFLQPIPAVIAGSRSPRLALRKITLNFKKSGSWYQCHFFLNLISHAYSPLVFPFNSSSYLSTTPDATWWSLSPPSRLCCCHFSFLWIAWHFTCLRLSARLSCWTPPGFCFPHSCCYSTKRWPEKNCMATFISTSGQLSSDSTMLLLIPDVPPLSISPSKLSLP